MAGLLGSSSKHCLAERVLRNLVPLVESFVGLSLSRYLLISVLPLRNGIDKECRWKCGTVREVHLLSQVIFAGILPLDCSSPSRVPYAFEHL